MTQTPSSHYQTTYTSQIRSIEALYRAAGIPAPARYSQYNAAVAAIPTALKTAHTAARACLDHTGDTDTWLDTSLDAIAKAHAAELLRSALVQLPTNLGKARLAEWTTEAITDTREWWTEHLDTLTTAAAALPTDPLNLDAIIEADATREWKQAQTALRALGTVASAHGLITVHDASVALVRMLPVLDLPDVTVEQVNKLHRETQNPDPNRDAVRNLTADAEKHGLDTALIRAARGDYHGVTLAVADSIHEIDNRHANAAKSNQVQVVETWN